MIRPSAGDGDAAPVFAVHPAGGLAWCYRALARALGDRPVIGLQSPLLDPVAPEPESLTDLARIYVDLAEKAAPRGGFTLVGWSLGGIIAHALAAEAERRGLPVERLILLESYPSECWRDQPEPYTRSLACVSLDCRHADLVSPRIMPDVARAIRAPWPELVAARETATS